MLIRGYSSQSQEVQKKCSKHAQNLFIFVNFCKFLLINAKKCKFLLIFTPIFRLKTNKSYKITLFATTSRPIFQKTPQKPLIFNFFYLFFSPFSSVFRLPSSLFLFHCRFWPQPSHMTSNPYANASARYGSSCLFFLSPEFSKLNLFIRTPDLLYYHFIQPCPKMFLFGVCPLHEIHLPKQF